MSKTKKIKRLLSKVNSLESNVNTLEWSVSELMKKVTYKTPSRYHTPRPRLEGGSTFERQDYEQILDYVYKAMDNGYRKADDYDEDLGNIRFIVYMSPDLISKMMEVDFGRDFIRNTEGLQFRGWEVIRVQARNYVHFVRVY
ncbi:hypothetical protein VPHK460_0283 [Vibrio phage K460]